MGRKLGDSYGSTNDEISLETGVDSTPHAAQKPVSRVSLVAAFLLAVGLMMLVVASNSKVTGQRVQSETSFNKIESPIDKIRTTTGERSLPKKSAPFDFSPKYTDNGKKA